MEVIIALKLSLKINSTKVVKKTFTSTATTTKTVMIKYRKINTVCTVCRLHFSMTATKSSLGTILTQTIRLHDQFPYLLSFSPHPTSAEFGLTLKLPWATETEFLITISIKYQADKWWEKRKISIRGLLVDPIPNSPN